MFSFCSLSLCFSVLCYLSSPCNYIVYCYEHIICIDSAQFDALLDNLSAFSVYVYVLYFASIILFYSIQFYSILFYFNTYATIFYYRSLY